MAERPHCNPPGVVVMVVVVRGVRSGVKGARAACPCCDFTGVYW